MIANYERIDQGFTMGSSIQKFFHIIPSLFDLFSFFFCFILNVGELHLTSLPSLFGVFFTLTIVFSLYFVFLFVFFVERKSSLGGTTYSPSLAGSSNSLLWTFLGVECLCCRGDLFLGFLLSSYIQNVLLCNTCDLSLVIFITFHMSPVVNADVFIFSILLLLPNNGFIYKKEAFLMS